MRKSDTIRNKDIRRKRKKSGFGILLAILLLAGYLFLETVPEEQPQRQAGQQAALAGEAAGKTTDEITDEITDEVTDETVDTVTVWYFDMGQGDASLVESDGHYMLIDTGNYEDVSKLRELLAKAGAEKLDYMIGTHPHADHIGSLATIIREYEIGILLMPDVETDTKTYRVAMEAAEKKELPVTHPAPGQVYELGQVTFQILAPNKDSYEGLNDYSIALRLSCQDTDFLWTGDAEEISEHEMLQNGLPLEAEVYQAGHHGSYTSSSPDFLEEVQPLYAVISCGKDNSYGYPHEETIESLEALGTEIYSTAEQGTIKVTCRDNQLQWEREGK